eukprot:GHVL01027911.1.p1 GENE.GHVL01027911.1~~GHVL01027911.1.p1  ORF type:complete len:264 (+),score=56.81 GHVL01027911.1:212-1003(+)
MSDFFMQIGLIKGWMSEVQTSLDDMEKLRNQAIQATSPEKETRLSKDLDSCLRVTTKTNFQIKNTLESLKAANEEFEKKKTGERSEVRIRKNMHETLTRRFQELLMMCQKIQIQYQEDVRQKAARQIRVVYPEASEEDINKMADSEDGGVALAIRSKMTGGHETLKGAVADIQDKYRDVRRLEQSVKDLHTMFVELATLIDQQGEMLDSIEANVDAAGEYTQKAEVQLISARKFQKSARKWSCCIMVVVLVLILIIGLPLLLT